MLWRAVVGSALALSAVAGCGLERSPIDHAVDGGPRDAGIVGMDVPRSDAGPIDAGPPFDAGPIDAGSDAGPVDVGGFDGGPPPLDAGTDAPITPIDTGIDAPITPIDAGAPDAPLPVDAGTDAPPLRTCLALYGTTDGYALCTETATSCSFYYDAPGASTRSCTSICTDGGGMCMAALDEGFTTGTRCTTTGTSTCGANEFDGVCVCTRVP